MQYGTLVGPKSEKGSIRSWVNYEPLDIEGVLLDSQAYLYGRLRVREMIASAPVALTQGDETAPLPDGFLDPLSFKLPNGLDILTKDPRELEDLRIYAEDGTLETDMPMAYSVFNELIQLQAKADAAYAARLLFYKRPALLGRTNQTNFLTNRYPNLLRACCLMHAADMMQDDAEYARWMQRTESLLASVGVEGDLMARGRDYSASVR